MDLSKVERQAPAEERRSEEPNFQKILLQDILCFFTLLSLGLLIVAGILCVMHNVSRIEHQREELSQEDHTNRSQDMSTDEPIKQERRCFRRGPTWIRWFRIERQQPQQLEMKTEQQQELEKDEGKENEQGQGRGQGEIVKLEDQPKQQPFVPDLTSTHQRINLSPEHRLPLQAAGDHVQTEAAGKKLVSEPQPFFASEKWAPVGYQNLMQALFT